LKRLDWLLVLLSSTDVCIRAKILLILWRAWHLRKDVVQNSGKERIAKSVTFLRTYVNGQELRTMPEDDVN
jgi:hypothetical protein